ncbi:hypothetical protein NQ318_004584 [Aromia moschata]|uniref:Synembryn-A n=1 Tax=Aromia moschata TaxID=1265417 RepID=A0AAV8XR14_9CUCU|nr:hypothetical protein NQ318_004584 [Aromia moschata]
MDTEIEALLAADSQSYKECLEKFIQNAEKTFTFPELTDSNKRTDLWKYLCNNVKITEDEDILKNCFVAIRILSAIKLPVCLEAQKSLCNIIFNCREAANKCCNNGILGGIMERIKHYKEPEIPEDIKFFDMKLLFLISAICPQVRDELKCELQTLIEILELILKEAAENHAHHEELPPVFLNDKQVDIVCELLKALFNLTVHVDDTNAEAMAQLIILTEVLRNYLLISTTDLEKTWTLRNNVINLLTNIPNECYKYLLLPIQDGHRVPKNLQFEGENMTAIFEILMFLKAKFNDEVKISNQNEMLSPVVTVLLKGATSNRPIRKFLRNHILPPLKDVHTRPEQGTTLRNHLCRLLTTPITQLNDVVAELLFVLCKKNVARMIKYTGYGNAAGLFAQRGLLAGGRDKGETEYSSDSSDSETEEYADHKHGINPVLGCYEEPHPNVMETMSEEQKEYEAMKLVELMDSLMKCGTIKPCRIGEDGKPKPVEHILELQEGLKAQQVHGNSSDSD